jgi:hypothetical protein
MSNTLLTSTVPSVTIVPDHDLGVMIKDIEFVVPPASGNSSTAYLTASGSITGSKVFLNNASIDTRFAYNETVTLTATNLGVNWKCDVEWIYYGDQRAYIDTTARSSVAINVPSRLRFGF